MKVRNLKILIAVIILVAVGAFGYLFVSKSKISCDFQIELTLQY